MRLRREPARAAFRAACGCCGTPISSECTNRGGGILPRRMTVFYLPRPEEPEAAAKSPASGLRIGFTVSRAWAARCSAIA